MTRFCACLACSKSTASEAGPSEVKNSNGKLQRNRHKRRSNGDNTDDTTVNTGFSGSKSSQRKKSYKRNNQGPSAWTAYSIARARYMTPQTNQPIIPTEIVGFSNRPAN